MGSIAYPAGEMWQESRCPVEENWSSRETAFKLGIMMPRRVGKGVGCVPRSLESGACTSGSTRAYRHGLMPYQ